MKTAKQYFFVLLALWSIIQFSFVRPTNIIDDWMGWRQVDTQTVARNFLQPGSNLFYPQINWGGDGPGYFESELQLYPAIIAIIMKFTGDTEWPGQILSLFFIALTGLVLFKMLNKQFGEYPSLAGAAFFLTSCGPVHLSTSVQPDSLCLLFYTLGLAMFIRFAESEKNRDLIIAVICTTLAALVKPTALNLGITQFIFVLLAYPKLLRFKKLWIGWFAILVIVSIYMAHSYSLYTRYGNTWGVLGGDSKFPGLRHFFIPWLYIKLSYMTLLWGIGIFGAAAGFFLIVKRKIQPLEWALIVGNLTVVFVTFRYTTNQGYGPHYHMFTTILSAMFIAHASQQLQFVKKLPSNLLYVLIVLLIFIQYGVHIYYRHNPFQGHIQTEVTYSGLQLAKIAMPEDLVITRSVASSVSREIWGKRENNYQDPRIFYIAKVRGWSIPHDFKGASLIKKYVKKGARYYVEPGRLRNDPELYNWLKLNSVTLHNHKDGRIYAFY